MKYLGRYISRLLGRSLTRAFITFPSCAKDIAVAWYKNLLSRNKVCAAPGPLDGILEFNGTDVYIEGDSIPDVTGSKDISFKFYIHDNTTALIQPIIYIQPDDSDKMYCEFTPNTGELRVYASNSGTNVQAICDLTSLSGGWVDTELSIVVTKTTGQISSVLINNQNVVTLSNTGTTNATNGFRIGAISGNNTFLLTHGYIWDIDINSVNTYSGYPNGNTDSAWSDTSGSIDNTVYGTGTTVDLDGLGEDVTYYCVDDAIGTRTDTVFFGQYLSSGTIDFKRTSGTFDYTDPSDGSLVEGVSIPVDGLYTIPANGICDVGVTPKTGHKSGLLDFDGIDDFIRLSADPDITGTKTVSFYMYLERSDFSTYTYILNFGNTSDKLSVFFNNDICYISTSLNSSKTKSFDISDYVGYEVFFEVDKINDGVEGAVVDIRINGVSQALNSGGPYTIAGNSEIGANGNGAGSSMASDMLIYDITVANTGGADINNFPGHPDGSLDAAWNDTVGTITATVFGTPSETENTYEYTSFYPVCERAGTVLHDVKENSTHISVDTPVWAETLHGSDYLNQQGYVDKDDFTAEGYNFETVVDGTTITLDDDCLVPLAQWEYVNLQDVDGENILDDDDNQLQVKQNI